MPAVAVAQNNTRVSTDMIGLGHTNILDTYLSPEEYRGTELRYANMKETSKADRHWGTMTLCEGMIADADSRSGNGSTISGRFHFQYASVRNWHATPQLRLSAGLHGELTLGGTYNSRNGNNPAQAIAGIDAGAIGVAEYDLTPLDIHFTPLRMRVVGARLLLACPLAGLAFSPQYGQSYYEIFTLGQYDHNVVPTTIVSTPSLRSELTFDTRVGNATVRVGWLGDYMQQDVNHIKRHNLSNSLVVGIVKPIYK